MVIVSFLSYANIYHSVLNNARFVYEKAKVFIDFLLFYWKSKYKFRNKFSRLNYILILCILFLIYYFLFTRQLNSKTTALNSTYSEKDLHLFINHIRDISILDQNYIFNINYSLKIDGIPNWLNQYRIAHLFNFYWLQNGAYLWHLQRMFDLKHSLINITKNFHQTFLENSNQTNMFDYLNHHPEYGVILDTALDPIQPLFLPLPKASSSFEKICTNSSWLSNSNLCQIRSDMIHSFSLKPLITYALYDVTIDICDRCKNSTNIKVNHYDELIFLFNSKQQLTNETFFVRQILPRLIRLLALAPESTVILLPYLSTKGYISQYLDVFIERGLINDKKRFVEYNSNEIYHSNVIYSTSSPRSDLILLNRILLGDKPPVRRELILIIHRDLDDDSYGQIIQTINLFEFPQDLSYLHIHEYNEQSYDLKQISSLFQQARIVIGMPTHLLSHIVWCQPHTHIIEIIQKTMTTDFYEISLQLQFKYWLVMTTKMNRIDMIDFRYLIMKVLADTDA